MSSGLLVIQERFHPRLIPALYQNFKDPIQAVLELVDNAVDDLVQGKEMIITVDVEKDRLIVVNRGGRGMGLAELDGFFAWGESRKKGKLGRYGQGGKAAMGYLGKAWKIRTTKTGEALEYVIIEEDWDDRTGGLKRYLPEEKKSDLVDDGVVQIDVWKLKRKINKNELRRILADTYRPLIRTGRVKILSGGRIETPEFPLEMRPESFEFQLRDGKRVTGWLGILQRGTKIRGGIRCFAFGRLIATKEYFGQKDPSFKESLDLLIGEINTEDEELPLLINKSDFDRGSPVWQEISKTMFQKMEPYVELLLGEKDTDVPTEKEQKTAKNAGLIWADFLRYLQFEQHNGSMPGLPTSYGQKSPWPKDGQTSGNLEPPREGNGEHHPATPPPIDAIGKRKRTGAFPEPKLQSLPEPVRYQLAEDEGIKVVKINTRFPLYKMRKNQLPLYIWETLAFEYAKAEDSETQTSSEYAEEVNTLLYNLGQFIRRKNIKITH